MEKITIKDVAKLSGVGISTVSRAMNNHHDINQDTKDRIMQVIKEHNYIPNNSARNLKRTDAKTIAVLMKGISNPFFSSMIQIFESEIRRKRYTFVLQHLDESQNEIDVAIQLEKEKRLNGIVFLGGIFCHAEDNLNQITVPFILSTIGLMGGAAREKYSSVSVDDVKESCRLTDHLIENGHRKIAIICSDKDDQSIGKLRMEGFLQSFKNHGLTPDETLFCPMKPGLQAYTMENGYAVTKELLESQKEFTAIYALSDSVAIGACRAIIDSGKSIPHDYSVVGFDGLNIGAFYSPSITTIRQPVEEMAKATITILFDMIKNHTSPQHLIFPGQLLIRESVRPYHL